MNKTLKITLVIGSILAFIAVAYFTNFLTSDYAKGSLSPVMP